MTTPTTWEDLHDATLLSVDLSWETGVLSIRVRRGTAGVEACLITGRETTSVTCLRQHPWGASASINEVRGPIGDGQNKRIQIEMQSGDVIVAIASEFVLGPDPG